MMIKPKYKCNKKRKIENVTVENNEIEKHKNYSQQQWICYCKIQHQHEILNKEYLCSDVIISAQNLLKIQFPDINGFQETTVAPVKSNGKWVSHNGFLPQDPPSAQIHHNGNQHWVLSTQLSNGEIYLFSFKYYNFFGIPIGTNLWRKSLNKI